MYSLALRIRKSGAEHVVRFELFEGNRLVYAIFFGTHHTKGSNLIKEAIWKIAPFGDLAFHGSVDEQLTLDIGAPDFQPLRTLLRQHFRNREWVQIEEVEDFVASDRTDYYVCQLRKGALVPMELDGQIDVDPKSRKKMRTYPPGTRIRFK